MSKPSIGHKDIIPASVTATFKANRALDKILSDLASMGVGPVLDDERKEALLEREARKYPCGTYPRRSTDGWR